MVLLAAAAIGAGVKEVFDFNRKGFKFDYEQRIEREVFRLEMQMKRFELFREDIRDLVRLTVDRMDVYHVVGALFLQFCVVILTKGRIQAAAPPFLLSLFLMTAACAFIYLLLAVWMSVHASIASHSFGVKLLTRFVRLPIPSMKHLRSLTYKLKDFERQGIGEMLRVPFQQGSREKESEKEERRKRKKFYKQQRRESMGVQETLDRYVPSDGEEDDDGVETSVGSPIAAVEATVAALESDDLPPKLPGVRKAVAFDEAIPLLAEEDNDPIGLGGDELLAGKSGASPERHVQLFRLLQAKWQCYDAYCRVCMSLGVNQMLQVLSYYAIAHTLVENHSPSTGLALVFMFQCCTVALGVFDLAGLKRREIIAVQVVGVMPCILSAVGMARGSRGKNGELDPDEEYPLSPLSFLLTVCWLELWLRISSPSHDRARLPRRFRQVLFLDVFGDAAGWDPAEAEDRQLREGMLCPAFGALVEADDGDDEDVDLAAAAVAREAVQRAASQLAFAQCAMRRWRAVPHWAMTAPQKRELDAQWSRLINWGSTIQMEFKRIRSSRPSLQVPPCVPEEPSPWSSLTAEERGADPFKGFMLGHFPHDGVEAGFDYDVEGERTLFLDAAADDAAAGGMRLLTLDMLASFVSDLETEARRLLEVRIIHDLRSETRRQRRLRIEASPALAAAGSFPNLVALVNNAQSLRNRRATSSSSSERGSSPPRAHRQPAAAAAAASSSSQQRSAPRSPQGASTAAAAAASSAASSATAAATAAAAATVAAPAAGAGRPPPPGSSGGGRRGRRGGQDQPSTRSETTYVAVAGKHAKHFVPERLPWQILSRMTRVLQACWFWAFMMALLKELDIFTIDYGVGLVISEENLEQEEVRRLCASELWAFEALATSGPPAAFFRPKGLSCLPAATAAAGTADDGRLLVGSAFAVHVAATAAPPGGGDESGSTLRLHEAFRPRAKGSVLALCAPRGPPQRSGGNASGSAECLLASASPGGLVIWPANDDPRGPNATALPWRGPPWQALAGATVPCRWVAQLLAPGVLAPGGGAAVRWCLLLAGWDNATFPVAALALPDGPGSAPPPSARLSPGVAVPGSGVAARAAAAADGSPARAVAALHVDGATGRLWAVWASGELQAWDLLASQSLGLWRPAWPFRGGVPPTALAVCGGGGGGGERVLYVLGGESNSSSLPADLARAQLPARLRPSAAAVDDTDFPGLAA